MKKMSLLIACVTFSCSNNSGGSSGTDNPSVDSNSTAIGGVSIFPAANPWNTDISLYPVHSNSDAYMASIGLSTRVHPDFGTVWENAPIGIPYSLVGVNTPKQAIEFDFADESEAGPYPIPENIAIEGGANSDGDRHIIMIDTSAGLLYEVWHAYPPGHPENPNASGWFAGSGAIFDLSSNELRPEQWTSADAAGLPIFPGLVRYEEAVEKGEIKHALRFTVSRSQRAYIHPATHQAGASTDANLPPMGLRVRLKASFDTSGYSPEVRAIMQALKTYGMLLADNGSNWYISGSPDSRWNDENLAELGNIHGSDFEAVETGELRY